LGPTLQVLQQPGVNAATASGDGATQAGGRPDASSHASDHGAKGQPMDAKLAKFGPSSLHFTRFFFQ